MVFPVLDGRFGQGSPSLRFEGRTKHVIVFNRSTHSLAQSLTGVRNLENKTLVVLIGIVTTAFKCVPWPLFARFRASEPQAFGEELLSAMGFGFGDYVEPGAEK